MAGGSLRSLIVRLEADIAQFNANMNTAAGVATKTMQTIQTAATLAKTALGALGVGVSVKGISDMVTDTIEATAALEKMSQKTGASVEALSAVRSIAKQMGADMDQVAVSIGKLDVAMVEAYTGSTKAQGAFKALGVSFRDDVSGAIRTTDDVLLDVAKRFSEMEDGAAKTALATQLFGRAGRELIPTLNALGEVAEYNVKITKEQAAIALDTEKSWRQLAAQGKELRTIFVNEITPAIDALLRTFVNMGKEAGGLRDNVKKFAADGSLKTWAYETGLAIATAIDKLIDFGSTTVNEAKRIYGAAQIIMGGFQELHGFDVATSFGGWDRGVALMKEGSEQVKKAWADLNAPSTFVASTKMAEGFKQQYAAVTALSGKVREHTADLGAMTKAVKEQTDARDALQAALDKQLATLDAQVVSWQKYGQAEKETVAIQVEADIAAGKYLTTLASGKKVWDDNAQAREAAARATAAQIDADKVHIGVLQEYAATVKKYNEEQARSVQSLIDALAAETKRNDTFGMTRSQLEGVTIAEAEHTLEMMRTAEATDVEIAAQEKRIAVMRQLQAQLERGEAQQNFANVIKEVYGAATNFFVDFFEHGTSAFKNLWDNFKKFAIQALAEIAAKQVVVSLVGALGVGGAGGAGAASNVLSQAGGASGLLTNITNLFSSGGPISGSLTNLVTGSVGSALGLSGGTAAINTAGWISAEGASSIMGAGGALGLTGAGAALMAAAPYAAIAAIAIPALISAFSSKGGGPMERAYGAAGADIGAFGDLYATHKLYTGAAPSSELGTLAATELATYNGVVKALGASPQAAAFAFYTSRDVKGTASQQLDVRALLGGKSVYTANIEDQIGRDPEALKARMATEASRAVLAALQATELPKYLADFFKSLDVATAAKEQIDAMIAIGTAIKQVADEFPQLGKAFESLDPASINALVDAVGGVEQLGKSVQFLSANFTTAANKADAAQKNLTEGFDALGLAVPKTHQDFLDLLASFDLTTDSGRKLYASVLALSGAFVDVKGTADQAAQSLAKMTDDLHGAIAEYKGGGAASTAQSQLSQDIEKFIADKPWAQQFVQAGGDIVDLFSNEWDADFAQYSEADQKLIVEMLHLGASVKQSSDTIAKSNEDLAAAQNAALEARAKTEAAATAKLITSGATLAQQRIDLFGTLASQAGGDLGAQIALQMKYIQAEIATVLGMRGPNKQTPYSATPKGASELKALQEESASLGKTLELFTTLTARYGSSAAEQLVKLTQTYQSQVAQLNGNAAELDLLNASFEQQWNAIINTTAQGVDGVQSQLAKLGQQILDYVASLKVGAESPLTPAQKIAEARAQYEATLAKAQAHDEKALGDITGIADTYIKLMREGLASSPQYTDFFNKITGELTALGTGAISAAAPLPMNAADQALLAALPTGTKLMSAADMQLVASVLSGGGIGGAPATPSALSTAALAALPKAPPSATTTVSATTTTTAPAATSGQMSEMMNLLNTGFTNLAISNTRDSLKLQNSIDASKTAVVEAVTVALK